MNSVSKKIRLNVTRDLNGWFKFSKFSEGKEYRVQLSGDTRKGGFWIQQIANKLGKPNFFKDLTEILYHIEQENIKRKDMNEFPIGIFNLHITNDIDNK